MEDYDEVVIKTVRDLFRSYPLVQNIFIFYIYSHFFIFINKN